MGFILRQGWAALDFGEEREIAQLRRLWESIELEIIRVLEASNQLKEGFDYEMHRLTSQTPAFFDETVSRHIEGLEKELRLLEGQAQELASEIEELTGERAFESTGNLAAGDDSRLALRLAGREQEHPCMLVAGSLDSPYRRPMKPGNGRALGGSRAAPPLEPCEAQNV